VEIETSDDAGLYFCEFQMYSSLAHLWKRREFQRAQFLHVNTSRGAEDIKRGVEVATALICAIIDESAEQTASLKA